ncbi:restriction endonuclease subunit S [Mesorhizobium sp. M0387]|uniref:restriction endonuclease subunit S n=1 Tax=Mesorhizobium sp. M0387 TaxID=2956940 RepID=UPI00333CFC85
MITHNGPWRRVALGQLGHWQGGSTPSRRVSAYWSGGNIPWISPKDFGEEVIDQSQDRITPRALYETNSALVPEGALLLVTRSGILKHSLPTAVTGKAVSINQDVKALLPAPGIRARYLQYQIEAAADDLLEAAVKSGTTVESIDFLALQQFLVIVATTGEQNSIVRQLENTLGKLERSRAATARNHERLNEVWAAALASAFNGSLTAGWRGSQGLEHDWLSVTLGDVIEEMNYGSSQKSQVRGAVPVLRMGNIQAGRLDWTDLVYTSDKREIEKHRLHDGDVLFNRTNSPELVGKTAVYHAEQPAIAAGYLIVVRSGQRILPDLLAHFLNSPAGRAYCWSVKSDGVSQSNINSRKLSAFKFGLPPLAEQAQIVERLGHVAVRIESLRERLTNVERDLTALRRQILRTAFPVGEEPEEPSSELDALLEAARNFKSNPTEKKRDKGRTMKSGAGLTDEITSLLKSKGGTGASFDEIRTQVSADYDTLKAEIFALLQEAKPLVVQVFDQAEGVVRLRVVQS